MLIRRWRATLDVAGAAEGRKKGGNKVEEREECLAPLWTQNTRGKVAVQLRAHHHQNIKFYYSKARQKQCNYG